MPTEIIPGGAYKLPDGSWVNAHGKKIAAPSGPVYKTEAEKEVLTEDEVTPGASSVDEFGNPIDPIEEGNVAKAKTLKKKK